MSSKSKKSSRKRQPAKSHDSSGVEALANKPEDKGGLEISDELVHVPKNTSPLRFILMIGLIVVLLIIFIVPGAIQSAATGGRDDGESIVGWRAPNGEAVEMNSIEWTMEKRSLSTVLGIDGFLGPVLGIDQGRPNDEQLARFLILDQLAQHSGLHVSDTDLAGHLRQLAQYYGGIANYRQAVAQNGGAPQIEGGIRRVMRVARYLQVAAFLGGQPDPESMAELWNTDHEELSFDFAYQSFDDLAQEARAELPSDEELSAWLDELPEGQRRSMQNPELRSAEIVSFRDTTTTPGTRLLELYPDVVPEGEEAPSAEERARQYYDQVYFWHFTAPQEENEDGSPKPQEYLSFEEVQEQALAEAPVYFAMQKWLAELRETSEETDLKALAEEYGLAYEASPAETRDAYAERETVENVGRTFATRVFQTEPGSFAYSVVTGTDALSIVRVTERIEPSMPPFEELRDQVVEMWVEERAQELALERLDAVREGLASEPLEGESDHEETEGQEHDHRFASAEDFRAAFAGTSVTLGSRAWVDKGAPAGKDEALDDATETFFQRNRQLYGLGDDEVSPPLIDPEEGRVYLVRQAGRRPVPFESIRPGDYQAYKDRSARNRRQTLLLEPGQEYLKEQFGLWFADPEGEG